MSKNPDVSSSGAEIAFDGEDLRLVFDRRLSDVLLMTFTVRPNPGKELVGFAAGLAAKEGFSGLYVIAKRAHWWQTPELAQVEHIIDASGIVRETSHTLCHGASMGAHGVLLSAARLGFRSGLMIAPQISVSPDLVPFENRWDEDVVNINFTEADGRVGLDSKCQYTVVYDPRDELDHKHVSMLPSQSNIRVVSVPFGGHTLPELLKETQTLSSLVVGLAREKFDVAAMRLKIRQSRWSSGHYFDMMSRTMMRRGLQHRAIRPARRWVELQPDSLAAFSRLVTLLRSTRDFEAILPIATRFTSLRSELVEGWRHLRLAAYQLEKHQLALEAAIAAIDCRKSGADDWRWFVRCMLRTGDVDSALNAFKKSIQLYPGDLGLMRSGIQVLMASRNVEEATLVAREASLHSMATEEDQSTLQRVLAQAGGEKSSQMQDQVKLCNKNQSPTSR